MVQRPPDTSGSQSLRPRARILRTFGDELISSETVALIELVKNSYDADAARVLIRFQEPLHIGRGEIDVIDNGHGMSLDTIQTAWMEPATQFRRINKRSESGRRRVLGEKGIGRFAASRLADRLDVITRRAGTKREARVVLDWTQFDDEQKYLDEIEIKWSETDPIDICRNGAIQALWEEGEKPGIEELTHGTILRMKGLRAEWSAEQFETLRTGLSRLISPFLGNNSPPNEEFLVRLELPSPFEHLSGVIGDLEALKSSHYTLKGYVDATGKYDLTLTPRGRESQEKITGQFGFRDGHSPECGPFQIELRVWDRDRASIEELAHERGSTIRDVRRDLNAVAGVNIYRNGFRVLPYGEPRNDWLRLDLRRVQNPTLRLSNNQMVGYVLISADENPGLRDQSNREGLIEGPAFDDLRALVTMALSEVETRRYHLRHPEGKTTTKPGGLFTDFDLAAVSDLVRHKYPSDNELLALVGEKERDLERRVEEIQEVLARYRRLATLGQLIDTVLHEGRAPLAKIGNEAHLGSRDVERTHKEEKELVTRLGRRFAIIGTQADAVATVFRKIEPFGGRKRGKPVQLSLAQAVANAFSVLDTEIADVGANVTLPDADAQVIADQAEVQEVIINLLQNSLYWLRKVPRQQRRIAVDICRKSPDEVEILFSDSGPGVDPKFQDRIFDPYFSTKPDGVGLGLTIAGEIISEYYAGAVDLLENGPLPGATFRITLRRRM